LKASGKNNKSRERQFQIPYNKSLKESRKGASQIYKKNAKNNNYNENITNRGSDTGKDNKSMKKSSEIN